MYIYIYTYIHIACYHYIHVLIVVSRITIYVYSNLPGHGPIFPDLNFGKQAAFHMRNLLGWLRLGWLKTVLITLSRCVYIYIYIYIHTYV